jgi:hypothetical protein
MLLDLLDLTLDKQASRLTGQAGQTGFTGLSGSLFFHFPANSGKKKKVANRLLAERHLIVPQSWLIVSLVSSQFSQSFFKHLVDQYIDLQNLPYHEY